MSFTQATRSISGGSVDFYARLSYHVEVSCISTEPAIPLLLLTFQDLYKVVQTSLASTAVLLGLRALITQNLVEHFHFSEFKQVEINSQILFYYSEK